MNTIEILNKAIAAVAPINGVSVGRWDDKKTWRIDFDDSATNEQRAAAQTVVDGFDVAAVQAQYTADSAAEKVRQDTFRNDPDRIDILSRLKTATAAQIRNYITANVTDLASARLMLTRVILLIALDQRS